MKNSKDFTTVAAGTRAFSTTHWSVVLQARGHPSPERSAALERLCRTYWFPLFAFLRRKGYSEPDAQDLTQQLFAQLLERDDFGTVDPRKGKFRTFLLAALTHFLSNERDRARAAKRGGGRHMVSLDEFDSQQRARYEPAATLAPDTLYDVRWAMIVLEKALAELRQEMTGEGRGDQFDLLKQYLTDEAGEGAYAATAALLGVTSQSVAVAVHRLRRRYRELVRAEVAQTVSSPLELEEEMRYLHSVLNQQ